MLMVKMERNASSTGCSIHLSNVIYETYCFVVEHTSMFLGTRSYVSVSTETMFSLEDVKKEINRQTKKEMTICYQVVPKNHFSQLMQR